MLKIETQCGCGKEVVVKASEVSEELVVQVRTTHQYTEKRASLRDRVERANSKPCSVCGSRDTSGSVLLCAKCRADARLEIG